MSSVDSRMSWLIIAFLSLMVCLRSTAAQEEEEPKGPPEPEDITLTTGDGVVLKCTYYPGTLGKEAIPYVLVHGWEGRRTEFHELALALQKPGHAVIVPDLRGHGSSTTQKTKFGDERQIDPNRIKDVGAAVVEDLRTVKRFLIEKNNAAQLNIEMLCGVGSEFGALAVMNWAVWDWSRPQLPAYKIGRDIKAMVLISPPQTFKGVSGQLAIKHPIVGRLLSTMIIVGNQDGGRTYSDAKRLYSSLKRLHAPIDSNDRKEQLEKQDLFYVELETSLQGNKLLIGQQADIIRNIMGFSQLRLINQKDDLKWTERLDLQN